MKKIIVICTTVALGFFSCVEEDKILTYHSADQIYFNFDDEDTNDRDSIFYTFAFTPDVLVDTIFLPVIVSGDRVSYDRTFKIEVIDGAGSTAQTNNHYEPLKDAYVMPADSGTVEVPFIMYSSDPLLKEQSVAVDLRLIPSEDFDTLLTGLNTARILFSNRLEKPEWWDYWQTTLLSYTRIKHQLYLIAVGGKKDLISSNEDAIYVPRSLFLIDQLRRLLNDPFAWQEEHADEFALEEVGDTTYHFFSIANPANVYVIQWFEEDGRYAFINEFGDRVTII